MNANIKKFNIPKCLESRPEVFGLSVQCAGISLGLSLLAFIMIAESIWITGCIFYVVYKYIKIEKRLGKIGGIIPYILSLTHKKEHFRVNGTINSLIQINKIIKDGERQQ
jgi:hypothetical protein